ncbi:hypothetical protein QCA50_001564 [Cerrena zonata]|uniref:Uncharacterized protein n=1 Tax=Cerrena zonata TaxID=2478898 RepID=A0AAW0GLB1_9APHY
MSYATTYPQPPPAAYPHSQPQQHYDDEDVKTPYDDLIDQYAQPFRQTSQHQAYNIDSLNGPPLSHKKTNLSDATSKELEAGTSEGADWCYPPGSSKTDKKEKGSFWSEIVPDSIACRLYVIVVLIETAIDLAIEADLFVRFRDFGEQQDKSIASHAKMPVYLAIFAVAHIFQFAMALDAVYARNTLQFIALTIFNAIFLVYSVIQIGEINGLIPTDTPGFSHIRIDVLTKIIPCVISVAEVAYIALGYKIYTEFGWKVYKFLGADRRIKTMYAHYQIFLCLVKFDLFFWVTFSIQFIFLVLNKTDAEYYLTCAALPLSIIVLIEGHLAARYENKWMMLTFMGGCAAAMVYFSYKLIKVIRFRQTDTFILVWKTMINFSILAIVLLLLTVVFGCLVMKNFGRGLKKQMAKSNTGLQRGKTQHIHRGPMSTHPNRMSIE